jgi:hypothetical protein
MLLRITAPHFVAGIIVSTTFMNHCAPILGYMKRWNMEHILSYCEKKGWKCERIDKEGRDDKVHSNQSAL